MQIRQDNAAMMATAAPMMCVQVECVLIQTMARVSVKPIMIVMITTVVPMMRVPTERVFTQTTQIVALMMVTVAQQMCAPQVCVLIQTIKHADVKATQSAMIATLVPTMCVHKVNV
jgi:hypothetical protein